MTSHAQFTLRRLLVAILVVSALLALWKFDPGIERLAFGLSFLIGFAIFSGRFRPWLWMPLAFSVAWQLQRQFSIVDRVPYELIDAGLGLLCFGDLAPNQRSLWSRVTGRVRMENQRDDTRRCSTTSSVVYRIALPFIRSLAI